MSSVSNLISPMRPSPFLRLLFRGLGVTALVSCADHPLTTAPAATLVSRVTIDTNPNSVLSFIVSVVAENADSVRVRCEAAESAEITPFARVGASGLVSITVVGLRAATTYSVLVEAIGRNGQATSDRHVATTGELPATIRAMRLVATNRASSGFTLVVPILPDTTANADGFVVAFDDAGEIRWYKAFHGQWPVEAKRQPNGHTTVFVGRSYGWQPNAGAYVELTPGGDVVRTFAAAPGYYTDPHELLLSAQNSTITAVHLLGYDIHEFDLSGMGGAAHTPLAVHMIERRDATGALQFRWSAATAFTIDDWPLPNPRAFDLVHPSSLALTDGGYVVSFQGMDEVTKIDSANGAILWRLGGRHNQFEIRDDPMSGFLGQHDVQVLDDGNLLMMDNRFRGSPGPARAVEYQLDARARVARMVWQYQPSDPVVSPSMGSVQRLVSGATLVGFGAAGRIDEVQADGSVTWTATLRLHPSSLPVPFYRAVRLSSLY